MVGQDSFPSQLVSHRQSPDPKGLKQATLLPQEPIGKALLEQGDSINCSVALVLLLRLNTTHSCFLLAKQVARLMGLSFSRKIESLHVHRKPKFLAEVKLGVSIMLLHGNSGWCVCRKRRVKELTLLHWQGSPSLEQLQFEPRVVLLGTLCL